MTKLLPYYLILLFLSGCIDRHDRTSSVYGHINDENGDPVDSILVTLHAFNISKERLLDAVYTDENGNYEMITDVPKGFSSLSVSSPFWPLKNPKFMMFYQGFSFIYKNDQQTNNCCNARVGERTKYDFKLMPR